MGMFKPLFLGDCIRDVQVGLLILHRDKSYKTNMKHGKQGSAGPS